MTAAETRLDRWVRLPRTSLAVVVGVTALFVWLLLGTVPVGRVGLVGVGAGLVLALSLWLVELSRWRAVATFVASLLVAPVAFGLVAAGVGTLAVVAANSLPVAALEQLRPLVVDLLASLFVVLGCVTAVFGAAAAAAGVVDTERTETYAGVALRTLVPPSLVGGAMFASGVVSFLESDAGTPGVQQVAGEVLGTVTGPLFAPAPGRTHLAVFGLLLAVTAVALNQAILSLPVRELAPETDGGPDVDGVLDAVGTVLGLTTALSLLLVPIGGLFELAVGQSALAGLLPAAVYDALVAVTGAPAIRTLLWRLLVASVAVVFAVWFLRRAVQSSAERVGTVLAPYVGGAVVTLGVLAVAGRVVDRATARVRETAPAPAGQILDQFVLPVLDVYGAATVGLLATAGVLVLASGAAGALWLALATGFLTERTAGATIAAAGLFVASAFAATLDAATPLVLAGLVAAVVVWDAGAFGSQLRRETAGAAATRRTELVHVGGTVAVGGVGALLTVGLSAVARGSIPLTADAAIAGLVACLVAVVALVSALR